MSRQLKEPSNTGDLDSEREKTTQQSSSPQLQVFYNSACPVCNYGIIRQQKKSTACSIDWLDVHRDNTLVEQLDRGLPQVRKYLHLMDADGKQHVGINAFILLWQNSPRERWLARIFSLPVLNQVSQLAYILFANALYLFNRMLGRW